MPGKTKFTRANKSDRRRAVSRPHDPRRVAVGLAPLPTQEELLAQHPEWCGDRDEAKRTGKPWLSPDCALRDANTGNFLKGSPRAFPPGFHPATRGQPVNITETIRRILRDNPSSVIELAAAAIQQGLEGDINALKVLLDRIDGPLDQNLNVRAQQFKEGIALADRTAPVPLPGLEPGTTNQPAPVSRVIELTNGNGQDYMHE